MFSPKTPHSLSPCWTIFALVAVATLAPTKTPTAQAAIQNPQQSLRNPIEQRQEMIDLLRSIDRRLATLEERLVPKPQ
jgi:hypothetical protein